MNLRHLIAERMLLEGHLVPAHAEITEGGVIKNVTRIQDGEAGSYADALQTSPANTSQENSSTQGMSAQGMSAQSSRGVLLCSGDKIVLPGGVDTHVHINEPGRTSWEGFATGTRAAALGGVTTLVDMPLNSIPPTVDVQALELKQKAAASQIQVDVGFWGGIVPGNTAQLRPLWEAGVWGFKCFLLDSGVPEFPPVNSAQLREAMTEVRSFGGLVIVHAEDAHTIEAASAQRHGPTAGYTEWADTRPHAAEVTAIAAVIEAVRETGCRTHILHLASAAALEMIAAAKAEGLPLSVETCPHYLCFEAETIPDGAAEFKCCPPIRDAGNRDALWQGLQEGIIDIVVSDHSPATAEEKYRGAPDLNQAWGGISGLQVGFTAVAAEARRRGISVEDVSRWMSTGPAQLVGLENKGRIAAGADADFLIYDPQAVQRITTDELAHRNPISAYAGLEIQGRVSQTVLRGRPLLPTSASGGVVGGGGVAGTADTATGLFLHGRH